MSTPNPAPTPADPGVSCEVTGFAGFEQQILRLRNSNRENPETLEYLRWRYESAPEDPPPCIFWLRGPDGQLLGMAAAIFRPYHLHGARLPVAVIGDISVDARYRGRGLGQMLLRYMTDFLDAHFPHGLALVIPTDSARRTLARVGWSTAGELSSQVYILDAAPYLQRILRYPPLARGLARALRGGANQLARRHLKAGGALTLASAPDAATYAFLGQLAQGQALARDLKPGSLEWRYVRHPHSRFTFATYQLAGVVRGLLVFEDTTLSGTCSIYELFAQEERDMCAMLAHFVLRSAAIGGLGTIRVTLDSAHPARTALRRAGFVDRPAEAIYQVHSRNGNAERALWRITQGDKDT